MFFTRDNPFFTTSSNTWDNDISPLASFFLNPDYLIVVFIDNDLVILDEDPTKCSLRFPT